MALLPAWCSGTVARPGSQAVGRWDPFGEFEDLYQRMDGAFDGLWQPSGQAWAPAADLTETGGANVAEVELPGVPKDETDRPRRIEVTGG